MNVKFALHLHKERVSVAVIYFSLSEGCDENHRRICFHDEIVCVVFKQSGFYEQIIYLHLLQ